MFYRTLVLSFALMLSLPANALQVFACEPEWASLLDELGGDQLEITSATTAFQDTHQIQARPSLIAAARNADLIVCTGADLEIGWLPLLIRRAGNAAIRVGAPGHFLASEYVRKLEIPKSIDRSQGDVHPLGNPHIQLHPRNIERIARALAERLATIDSGNAAVYNARLDDFLARWDAATQAWEAEASDLAGLRIVSHRTSFSYLADWLDLDVVATLEPKPGIPASGAQLAHLLEQLVPNPPAAVVRAPFESEKAARWLSERLDIPVIVLPFSVGGNDAATDLFSLFSESIRLLKEQQQ